MDHHLKDNVLPLAELTNAWNLIQQAKKITLLTHFRPDGDGIAACAALEHIFHQLNKQVETIYPCSPEFDFKHHPKKVLINTHEQIPDLIIMCDTATYARAYYPDIFKNIPLINIDHHISNTVTGTHNFVGITCSSACEMLFQILHEFKPDLIDKHTAECLLSGILYDSLIFQAQATTPQTLRIAAYLIEKGADLYTLKTEHVANKNPQIIALWGKIMSSVQIIPSGKAVLAKITQKDLKDLQINLTSLVGFHNFLSQVSTVDVTILLYEMESGQTKVSLRSKVTDVNKLAAKFDGGGHKNAAGFLSNLKLEEVAEQIIATLDTLS